MSSSTPAAASASGSGGSGAAASASSSGTSFLPDKPKMGDLEQVNATDFTPWTGGMPKVDWSALDDSCKNQPITPSMYRAVGSKDAKSYQFRIRGLPKKLDSALSTPLNTFISAFMNHMKLHGMDTISYLPDPGDSTKMCSVVTHYTRFKLANVSVSSKALYENEFDAYDKANDKAAQLFLTNSVSASLYLEVENNVNPDDTFVIMWMKVLQLIHRNTHQFFTEIENQIKACDPVTDSVCNPGQ